MTRRIAVTALIAALTAFMTVALAHAAGVRNRARDGAGRIEALVGGRTIVFPILHVSIEVEVDGDLALVTTIQEFANPVSEVIDATYLFPLDESAAVHEMELRVGDEAVRAHIREKQEARREFETARAEGRGAALLEQHRPNMFTQRVANVVPGLPITVTLRHVQPVPRVDGAYELVLPLVVGPRYVPSARQAAPASASDDEAAPPTAEADAPVSRLESLPPASPVAGIDAPDVVEDDRVSILVRVNAGIPLREIKSPSHSVDVANSGGVTTVSLASGTVGDRDFVLLWRVAGDEPAVGVVAHARGEDVYISLLVEPPATPHEEQIAPREVVYLLDCSGSMAGIPMAASKAFVGESLDGLRARDAFRVVRFSDSATEFSSRPLEATEENIAQGRRYLAGLSGEGGTRMTSGIRQALEVPPEDGRIRIVVFLTDGYIGNEDEVFALVDGLLGDARLFVLGVSSSPNRYLLSELSRIGRGFTRYMDPTDTVDGIATEMAAKLDAPVLTDVSIDWGGLRPIDVVPERFPDLFAGRSVRVMARCLAPETETQRVTVWGTMSGRLVKLPAKFAVGPEPPDGSPVVVSWARAMVADLMADHALPPERRRHALSDEAIRGRVIEFGLAHSLVTQWTSFVAVTEKVLAPRAGGVPEAQVAVPRVAGAPDSAYPGLVAEGDVGASAGGNLHGTPEPEWAGALVALMAVALLLVVRRGSR